MTASTSARAIAREQLTAAILTSARAQLGTVGPAALSVRAVARDVGMVSSAVYRYFPSRDDLITELLVIGYTELAEAAEAADAAVADRADRPGRWRAVAHAFRGWARSHPFDYALLYGSPVPGYAAPRRTVEPALRVPRLILDLVSEDGPGGAGAAVDDDRLHRALQGVRDFTGGEAGDEPLLRGLVAWSGLIGSVTLELFGHLAGGIEDYDAWFDATIDRLAPA